MRQRNIKGARKAVNSDKENVFHPGENNELFENFIKNPNLYLEIGAGKGQFIHSVAKDHPDINFLGLELKTSIIYRLLQKQQADPQPNLLLVNMHAKKFMDNYLPDKSIDVIYLNFSDPWPKKPRKRLTSHIFLEPYYRILKDDGKILLKTDSSLLFEYTFESIGDKFEAVRSSQNLHNEDYFDGYTSEYEDKFADLGNRIYYIELIKKELED